jgi:putative oxidoreductase
MDWILLLGRILFAFVFVSSGLGFHLQKRELAIGYTRSKGLPAPELAVLGTGVLIIVAGLMIVIGLWVDLAALAIFAFLLGTAFLFHNFWTLEDPQERMLDMIHFQKDLALAGGALAFFYLFQQFGDAIGITIEPALFD